MNLNQIFLNRKLFFVWLVSVLFLRIANSQELPIGLMRDLKHGDEVICKVNLGRFGFKEFPAYVANIPNVGDRGFIFWVTTDDAKMNEIGGFSGMSGSPVYFQGKLIGAIGYGYNGLRKFCGGVTPAELFYPYFAEIPFDAPPGYSLKGKLSAAGKKSLAKNFKNGLVQNIFDPPDSFQNDGLSALKWVAALEKYRERYFAETEIDSFLSSKLEKQSDRQQINPSRLTNTFSSVVGKTSRFVQPPLEKSLETNPFVEGSPCAIPIAVGDVVIAASGTVTTVDGDKVVAFGHPLSKSGHVKMPLYTFNAAETLTSYRGNFWTGSLGRHVGTLYYDGSHAVVGRFEKQPLALTEYMLPINFSVMLPGEKKAEKFNFSMVKQNDLMYWYLPQACDRLLGDLVELEKKYNQQDLFGLLNVRMYTKDSKQVPIDYKRVVPNIFEPWRFESALYSFMFSTYEEVANNDAFFVDFDKFDIQLEYRKLDQMALIVGAVPDKPAYFPGEVAIIKVKLQNYYGDLTTQDISYKIPNNVATPLLQINLGPQSAFENRKKMVRFGPAPNSWGVFHAFLDTYEKVRHVVGDDFSYQGLSIWSEVPDDSSYSGGGYGYEFGPLSHTIQARQNFKSDLKGKMVIRGKTLHQKFVIQDRVFSLSVGIKKEKE